MLREWALVKIHYIGFSQDFEEWRDPSEIVSLHEAVK